MRGLLLGYTERVIALETQVEDMREDVEAHERLTKAGWLVEHHRGREEPRHAPEGAVRLAGAQRLDLQARRRRGVARLSGQVQSRPAGAQEHDRAAHRRHREDHRAGPRHAEGLSALAKLIKPTAALVA